MAETCSHSYLWFSCCWIFGQECNHQLFNFSSGKHDLLYDSVSRNGWKLRTICAFLRNTNIHCLRSHNFLLSLPTSLTLSQEKNLLSCKWVQLPTHTIIVWSSNSRPYFPSLIVSIYICESVYLSCNFLFCSILVWF